MSQAVVIVSGGLDSTTLMYYVVKRYEIPAEEVQCLSFDYGQRHKKELEYAQYNAEQLGCAWSIVRLPDVAELLKQSTSSLVGETDVPDGHYAEENMKQTIVPNRNSMMLNIAVSIGMAQGANNVWTGVHAGDHFIYPDCRPQFFDSLNAMLQTANEGFKWPFIATPFAEISKADIADAAYHLGVRYENTWSCYKGGDFHCGRCGTCVERLEAIHLAGHDDEDSTYYIDKEYWKTVTNG